MDRRILGFACAFLDHDPRWGTFLDNLHVAHDSRRRRIGSGLMAEIGRWCITHSSTRGLYVWVVESNRNAQRFYERLGATCSGYDYWSPPGGGSVRRLLYTWSILDPLLHCINS
jgi:GNAT superfamily N-acetyltransferase